MSVSDTPAEADPPKSPDLREWLANITGWHASLRPVFRIAVTLTVFVAMTAFYVLMLAPDDFEQTLALSVILSPVALLALFIARAVSGRQINELAAALLFSAIIPFTMSSIFFALAFQADPELNSVLVALGLEPVGVLTNAIQMGLILFALLGSSFCLYRLSSGNEDDTAALLQALPVVAGIATVMLVHHLLQFDDAFWAPANQYLTATTAQFAIIGYYWRRGDVAAFLIWPLSALMVCTAVYNDQVAAADFSLPIFPALYARGYIALAMVPALVWWAFGLFIDRRAGRLESGDRLGVGLKALYRHWERSELVGAGAVEQLPNRTNQLLNDLVYLGLTVAVACGLLYLASQNAPAVLEQLPLRILLPFFSVLLAIGYQLIISLFKRLWGAKRLRFSAIVLAALLSLIPTVLIAYYIWNVADIRFTEDQYLFFALQCALWVITQHIMMRLVRDINYTSERVRFGAMTLLGAFVAFIVFRFFLGPEAYVRFEVGIPVGAAGWLMTILFLIPVYLYHFREKSAFLVWPVGAAVAGTLLRIFVQVEGNLADISEFITVKADMNEVVLAAFFGAAAGSLGLLAKQIWYDKDPTKRARAVRVRGLFTIIHAVSPLIAFLLFLMVANSFRENANVIIADATGNFVQLTASVVKIKDRAQQGAIKLKQQADQLADQVTRIIPAEAKELAADIKNDANALVDQTSDAAKRVGEAAVKRATETAVEVGDKLSEAFTPEIDFGFLGKLKLPDLGIGKFFRNLIGGMIPDLNLEELFKEAMASLYTDVEKQFEEPIRTAEAMRDKATQFITRHGAQLAQIKDDALAEAHKMVADIVQEKENTILQINALVTNAINFFYQLLLFLILATGTIMAYLAWQVINGMVFMVARVSNGWTMLRHAVDVQYEKQIL